MSTPGMADIPARATAVVAVADAQLRRSVIEALAKTSVRCLDESHEPGDIDELAALVEQLRPSILFLGLPGVSEDPSAAVARIANLAFAPRVVAVSATAAPGVIRKAMRAGAAEFVYPPFEAEFDAALKSVLAEASLRPEAPVSGKVVGFTSVKGGCGATTLACHSASWLKNAGKKDVLLADLDAAAGIAATLMRSNGRYSLDDALQNQHRLDLRLWKALVATSACGVDVLPAPPEPPAAVPPARKMASILRFWRAHYEWTFADLGHGLSYAFAEILSSIDTVVLVTTNEIPALRQARQTIQYLAARDFGASRVKLVLNRMPKRAPIGIPELEKIMGLPVHTVIPDDYRALSEAYSHPQLVDLESDLGRHFGKFAASLAGVAAAEKKTRRLFALR